MQAHLLLGAVHAQHAGPLSWSPPVVPLSEVANNTADMSLVWR